MTAVPCIYLSLFDTHDLSPPCALSAQLQPSIFLPQLWLLQNTRRGWYPRRITMTPPPPLKIGQREFFNDSFFSFFRRNNKSQLGPPPGPHSPDSQAPLPITNGHGNGYGHTHRDEDLGEKKRLLQEGLQLVDSTKDMLEMNAYIFGKETTKKYRKEAAKCVPLFVSCAVV